ncbi:hypothetical protein B5M09_006738 [Aphanomyces astaci]|uniref:Uncharacterized protein n=1 Tax=Aphanomyces astaci TaxID=112090 RepID=A0A3R7Y2J4_APHAT|nr:hypothetical protein B5M09_006738 [Aphanomyces astaci]
MVRSATGRELTDDERTALYHRLLQLKKNGRVSSGDIKELMRTFHVSQQTISHILLRGCQTAAETGCAKVASRKKGRCVSKVLHQSSSTPQCLFSKVGQLKVVVTLVLNHNKHNGLEGEEDVYKLV